mgnify:CR=1 FL=1
MGLRAFIHQRIRRKPQVYLRPTIEGWWWMGTLFVLMLMGWGYTNNLCLALGMILSAVTVVLLMEAHFNLDGVRLNVLSVEDQHQGQAAPWRLWWQAKRSRARHKLFLHWDGAGPAGEFSLPEKTEGEAHGAWEFSQRGVWRNTHVKLASTYPLGLFRAWSYHKLPTEAWVYPKQVPGSVPNRLWDEGIGQTRAYESHSGDEPGEFRRYQESDSPTRIAWKAMARGLPLHAKTFVEEKSQRAFYQWPWGTGDETARGRLAYMIEQHYRGQESWALQIHGQTLLPDSGALHRQRSLRALTEDNG